MEGRRGTGNGTEDPSRPKVRLFLSYAEEDHAAVDGLVSHFRDEGFELYDWQDPSRRGGRIVDGIEAAIGRADAFLAFLSPHFLTSPWCRLERNLALHREMDRGPGVAPLPFIFVLEVAKTPYPTAGFLRDYDWFDLTTPRHQEQALADLTSRLREIGATVAETPATTSADQVPPLFRNRGEELKRLVAALTNPADSHFWLVISPPELGKSWFLDRLNVEMAVQSPKWVTRLVDVKEEPLDIRNDAARLCARFFGSGVPHDVAQKINTGTSPYLCLLDSAELLQRKTARELRFHLGEIYQLVQNAGNINVRLAFVAASRRQDDWKGVEPKPRFSALPLTQFKVNVVNQALRDLAERDGRAFTNDEFQKNAERVHQLSEGLPALLVRCLHWIQTQGWTGIGRLETQELFEQLARPYIQGGLLSLDSLFPWSGDNPTEQRTPLEQAFRVLAPYRLFTQSHLRHHAESDATFRAALVRSEWPVGHLWRAISDTALLLQPLDEPWLEIHPAIRRLLYRYFYTTDRRRAGAHRAARTFYDGWGGSSAGKEQGVVLVECLWHEAAFLLLKKPKGMEQLLIRSARRLSQTLRTTPAFAEDELRAFTARRMRDDEELQDAVGHSRDLFEVLVEIVEQPPGQESAHG